MADSGSETMAVKEQWIVRPAAAASCGLEYHIDDSLSSHVERMVNNPFLSDITFVVGPAKQRIYAHKSYLVPVSEYFFTLFYGNFSESKRGEIELKDEDPEIFLTMLRIIYGAKVDINFENLYGIYQHIQMYLLSNEYCKPLIDFLMDQIVDKDTAMKIFRENQHYKFELVDEVCLSYIQSDPLYYFKKDDFATLEQERLRKILGLQKINCTEDQLLHALDKWELANPESNTKQLRKLVSGTTRAYYSHKMPTFWNGILLALSNTNFCEEFSLTLSSPKSVSLYGIGIYLWPTVDNDVTVTLGVPSSDDVYTEICKLKFVKRRNLCLEVVDLMFEEMMLEQNGNYTFHLSIENIDTCVGLTEQPVGNIVHHSIDITFEESVPSRNAHALAHLWVKDPKCGVGAAREASLSCC